MGSLTYPRCDAASPLRRLPSIDPRSVVVGVPNGGSRSSRGAVRAEAARAVALTNRAVPGRTATAAGRGLRVGRCELKRRVPWRLPTGLCPDGRQRRRVATRRIDVQLVLLWFG